MKRLLLNTLITLSLLLLVTTAALWIRGTWRFDELILKTPYTSTSLITGAGRLHLLHLDLDYPTPPEYILAHPGSVLPPTPGWHISHETGDVDGEIALADRIIRNDSKPWPSAWSPIRLDRGAPANWRTESPPYADGWQLTLPAWLLLLLFALLPAWRLLASRPLERRRRRRQGLCPTCAYDLRASTTRCPECGTPVPTSLTREPIP